MSTPATTTSLPGVLTIEQIQQLPFPDVTVIWPISRRMVLECFFAIQPDPFDADTTYDPIAIAVKEYGDRSITIIARQLLMEASARGPSDPASADARDKRIFTALLSAYADVGYTPPAELTPQAMLAIYDQLPDIYSRGYDPATGRTDNAVVCDGTIDRASAYAMVAALSMGDFYLAYTIADSPAGAGINWGLTRQDFRKQHDLPADGRD